MEIRFVRPSIDHKEAALDFKKEFKDNGENVINGSEMLDNIDG